jgi:hypothetical protein
MPPKNVPPTAAERPTAIFDPLHLYDRIVHIGLGVYGIGAGAALVWRALTGPDAIQTGKLLQGILFAGLLGPFAIYWLVFRSSPSTAKATAISMVKRIVGSLAALVVTAAGLATMWISIVHPVVKEGAPLGVDWDSILGPSTLVASWVSTACMRSP